MAKAKSKSKSSTKKKSTKRSVKTEQHVSTDRSVSVRKAVNGYVVSSWTEKGDATFIAKNEAEATRYIKKLL
jgi:hypothetical protein